MPFSNLNWGEGRTAPWVGLLLGQEHAEGTTVAGKSQQGPRVAARPGLSRAKPLGPVQACGASERGGRRPSHSCLSREGKERGPSFSSASPPWPSLPACLAAGSPRGARPRQRSLPSGPAAAQGGTARQPDREQLNPPLASPRHSLLRFPVCGYGAQRVPLSHQVLQVP